MALTSETLTGAYAFVPIPWNDGELMKETLKHDVAYLAETKIDGLFLFDSTGEFFAVEHELFKRIVDIVLEASNEMPVQVNCAWPNQDGALERAEYAGAQGADAVRFTFPFWEALTVDEAIEFAEVVADAADPAPLVHYNISRAKIVFGADEYQRLIKRVPEVIGTKLATNEQEMIRILAEVQELQHFVGEHHFAPMMAAGASGSYSWLGTMNPRLMREWHRACADGDWNRAIEIQQRVWAYGRMRLDSFTDIHTDAGYNKIDAAVNPNINCPVDIRDPYTSGSSEDVKTARRWAEENAPELVTR